MAESVAKGHSVLGLEPIGVGGSPDSLSTACRQRFQWNRLTGAQNGSFWWQRTRCGLDDMAMENSPVDRAAFERFRLSDIPVCQFQLFALSVKPNSRRRMRLQAKRSDANVGLPCLSRR
jgi:hypothetical protein